MKRRLRNYTKEFIQEAIHLAMRNPSIGGTAKELGIPTATLYTWVSQAKKSGDCIASDVSGQTSKVNVSLLLNENKQLRKQITQLEQEKSILKKAATYFAKELR